MKRVLKWALSVLGITLLLFVGSLEPFLWPHTDEVERADAVFILSGDHGERLPKALDLMERRVAPTLVFIGTIDRLLEEQLCRGGRVPYEVLCVRPVPDSTRQEARAAAQLSQSRRWRTIVVVTSTHHVARSSLLFRRCFDGSVKMVGGRAPFTRMELKRQIAHEWVGLAHALTVARGC